MTKAEHFNLPILNKLSTRTLFFTLSALLITLFFSYVFLVNKAVMNVVAREEIEEKIATRTASLNNLEFEFLTLKNGVTLDRAYAQGFRETEASMYLSKTQGTPLTYDTQR